MQKIPLLLFLSLVYSFNLSFCQEKQARFNAIQIKPSYFGYKPFEGVLNVTLYKEYKRARMGIGIVGGHKTSFNFDLFQKYKRGFRESFIGPTINIDFPIIKWKRFELTLGPEFDIFYVETKFEWLKNEPISYRYWSTVLFFDIKNSYRISPKVAVILGGNIGFGHGLQKRPYLRIIRSGGYGELRYYLGVKYTFRNRYN